MDSQIEAASAPLTPAPPNAKQLARGGRPPSPRSSADSLARISAETVKPIPSVHKLRLLSKLHKAFVVAEQAQREERRVVALEEAARATATLAQIKSDEARRRFSLTPLGQRALLQQVEKLKARVAELELAGKENSDGTI